MHLYKKDFHALCAEQKTDVTITAFKSYVSRKVQISITKHFLYILWKYDEADLQSSVGFAHISFFSFWFCVCSLSEKFMSSIFTCDLMPIIFLVLRFEHRKCNLDSPAKNLEDQRSAFFNLLQGKHLVLFAFRGVGHIISPSRVYWLISYYWSKNHSFVTGTNTKV